MCLANVSRMPRASSCRPVSNVSPSRLIMVSASPVREPVIAGDDRCVRRIVLLSAGGLSRRGNDESIGGQHEFVRRTFAQRDLGSVH